MKKLQILLMTSALAAPTLVAQDLALDDSLFNDNQPETRFFEGVPLTRTFPYQTGTGCPAVVEIFQSDVQPLPIASGITISTPGKYCLAEDIDRKSTRLNSSHRL